MLSFVNAKINIGLYVTSRRQDGYHNLETVFYPVGKLEGLPESPVSVKPFCDILEIIPGKENSLKEDSLIVKGRQVDCPQEKNLVWRALQLYRAKLLEKKCITLPPYSVTLLKNLPDGAGLGGGSADASFTLKLLNQQQGYPFDEKALEEMALSLGADCPFFIRNYPSFASGVGECMEDITLSLTGWWIVIAKPQLNISTKEAFSGMVPHNPPADLRQVLTLLPEQWRAAGVFNQFETTLFPLYPELEEVKSLLYESGASYASMSGSGAALYGLYRDREIAKKAIASLPSTLEGVWLLQL